MARLEVTANTSQAVGEHDKLTSAVDRTSRKIREFSDSTDKATGSSKRLASEFGGSINGAFDTLNSTVRSTLGWMERISAGVQIVFNSILKELDKIQGFNAVMSVTTGSSDKAAESFSFLRKTADLLGVQFDALSNNYAKLVAAIPPGNEQLAIAQRTFLGVSMAARTLHASNQDTQLMFYAVTQIASKGVVSMEELRRQLGEKMPGALQIAARAFNTTTDELEKAIRKGIVNSEKFLAGFSSELIRTFSESAAIASNSVSAAVNRLTNVWVDFVKVILDSGAGQAIVGVFDALREKLSDPYIISQFAAMIKTVADRVAEFVKNLTAEDLRNGFDSFAKAVDLIVTAIGKLINGLSWIMNNADKIAPIIGGLYGAGKGAALGSLVGPEGAIVGGALGFFAGAATGAEIAASIKPTQSPGGVDLKTQMDANAQLMAKQIQVEQEQIANQYHKLLKTYGLFMADLPRFGKSESLNTAKFNEISSALAGDKFSSDAQRKQALIEYNKYGGAILPPKTDLSSILGPGKGGAGKKDPTEGTLLQSMGYDRNFLTEWANLDKLFEKHLLTLDELDKARDKLLDQQPIFIQQAKEEKEARDLEATGLVNQWKAYDRVYESRKRLVESNEEYIATLQEQTMLSSLSPKQEYMYQGMKDFDQESKKTRREMEGQFSQNQIEDFIAKERQKRSEQLAKTFDQQMTAQEGLLRVTKEFSRVLMDQGTLVAQTWTNIMGGLQGMWEKFFTTGKLQIKDLGNLLMAEMAKVTWNRYAAPVAEKLITSILGFSMLENGGVMTSAGQMSLKKYSSGGVANSPQLAMFGEGRRPEAYVPLPDGRSIPVTMQGGGSSGDVFNINQTLHIGSNVSRAEVAQALAASNSQLKADILRSRSRSGAFS